MLLVGVLAVVRSPGEIVQDHCWGGSLSGFWNSVRSNSFVMSLIYSPSPPRDRPASAGCRWRAPLTVGEFQICPDARVDGALSQRCGHGDVSIYFREHSSALDLNNFKLETVALLLV